MPDTREYNPLDYENLTRNLVRELMDREEEPLPPSDTFVGAGVYALFYHGHFIHYQHPRIRSENGDWPIYVGKAVPPGARVGASARARATGRTLYGRLREHAESIAAATNLELNDFRCRFLVVTPLWITMAERFLIEDFQPVWNVPIAGFGNHDPGAGRHQGEISWWDALHPGREWATRLRQTRTAADAQVRLHRFIELLETSPEIARRQAVRIAEQQDEQGP
ncbi:MAG: Eco29kI family restriction endonuclease [Dehalococcoidia bacterium]